MGLNVRKKTKVNPAEFTGDELLTVARMMMREGVCHDAKTFEHTIGAALVFRTIKKEHGVKGKRPPRFEARLESATWVLRAVPVGQPVAYINLKMTGNRADFVRDILYLKMAVTADDA